MFPNVQRSSGLARVKCISLGVVDEETKKFILKKKSEFRIGRGQGWPKSSVLKSYGGFLALPKKLKMISLDLKTI